VGVRGDDVVSGGGAGAVVEEGVDDGDRGRAARATHRGGSGPRFPQAAKAYRAFLPVPAENTRGPQRAGPWVSAWPGGELRSMGILSRQ